MSMCQAKPSLEAVHTVCALCSDTARKSDVSNWVLYGWLSSATVQTGPWGPPSLLYNGYRRLFPGNKAAGGVALTTHTHLAPWFKIEYSYTPTPPLGLRGLL